MGYNSLTILVWVENNERRNKKEWVGNIKHEKQIVNMVAKRDLK